MDELFSQHSYVTILKKSSASQGNSTRALVPIAFLKLDHILPCGWPLVSSSSGGRTDNHMAQSSQANADIPIRNGIPDICISPPGSWEQSQTSLGVRFIPYYTRYHCKFSNMYLEILALYMRLPWAYVDVFCKEVHISDQWTGRLSLHFILFPS